MKKTKALFFTGLMKLPLIGTISLMTFCGPGKAPQPGHEIIIHKKLRAEIPDTNPPVSYSGPSAVLPCESIDTSDNIPMKIDTNDVSPSMVIEKDSITLSWSSVTNLVDTICAYQLIYCHKTDYNKKWRFFRDRRYNIIGVSPDTVKIRVARIDIDTTDPTFYFGVRCKTMDGVKSDIHATSDSTALSKGCLLWKKP
jgi:hypothetical protein